MPRPEGIATFIVISETQAPLCRPERMPRPEGIATQCFYGIAYLVSRAGTNAPTRGDCDEHNYLLVNCPLFCRNECPDQRGLRLQSSLFAIPFAVKPERMPRPEGIATWTSHRFFCLQTCRNECPDQRGLRPLCLPSGKVVHFSRNECPDQRGLRLHFFFPINRR